MQGELTVSSDTHQGSVFTLRLPRYIRTSSSDSRELIQDENGDEQTTQDVS